MARLHFSGFTGLLSTVGKSEWATASAVAPVRDTTVTRLGPYSCLVDGLVSGVRKRLGTEYTSTGGDSYFFRFYLNVETRPGVDCDIFHILADSSATSTTGRLSLRLRTTGTLAIYLGTTNLLASGVIPLNTWTRVEVMYRRDAPSTGVDIAEFRINGTTVVGQMTGLTLSAMGGAFVGGNLNAEANTVGKWRFADYAHNDSTGAVQNSWCGEGAITYLRPDGVAATPPPLEGTVTGAASAWQALNEVEPDNTTSYVLHTANSSTWSAAGSRTLVTCQSAASAGIGASDTISLVAVGLVFSAVTTGGASACVGARYNGVIVDASVPRSIVLSTDCFFDDAVATMRYAALYTAPDGSAWSPAVLDALDIGARSPDTAPNTRITTIWAAVEYVPAVPSGLTRVTGSGKVRQGPVGSLVITLATAPTVGNGLVVLVNGYRSSGMTFGAISDNKGHTYVYTSERRILVNGEYATAIWFLPKVVTGGGPFTITLAGVAGDYYVASVVEVGGLAGGSLALDTYNTNAGTGTATPGTPASASMTGERFIAATMVRYQSTASIAVRADTPAFVEEMEELDGTNWITSEGDSKIVTLAGTTDVLWTMATTGNWASMLLALKAQAAAGGALNQMGTIA